MPGVHASRIAAAVIGGSAGALDVVRSILAALPPQLAVPVTVLLHLPEHSQDQMARVLGHGARVPVKQAEDKERLQAGQVYVAPAAYHLLIEPTRSFALSLDAPVHYSRPAIDVLFESACDAYREQLLAVLLSGASEDGAAGLQEVHAAGGITIVQDPDSAEVAIMPRAALALFSPTHTWPPAKLAARLPQLLSAQ
jgi:two-component system, chemotaxis family, protein-glutamate methylesterase/glutaminase